MPLDKNTEIPVKCPHCSKVFHKPLRELKAEVDIVCPSCGGKAHGPADSADLHGVFDAIEELKRLAKKARR